MALQVSESSFKDHAAVFENLHWDILKETGYMSWFGLAFTLAGYLSYHCQMEAKSSAGEKWSSLRSETDFIIDQLDELKLCLEVDNDMYKIAAGTLLYCCAAVRLLKKKNRGFAFNLKLSLPCNTQKKWDDVTLQPTIV